VVEVTDDRLFPAEKGQPVEGDLVELWIDPRPMASQGRASHSQDVFGMFVVPNKFETPKATWLTLDPAPKSLEGAGARSGRTREGYYTVARLPLSALGCATPEDIDLKGFELAVDDSDALRRDTQLVWMGTGRAFIDASMYGALTVDETKAGSFRLCVR
jgi:hypothetical protein